MTQKFAFFSEQVHAATHGKDTVTIVNPTGFVGTKGERRLANFFGSSVSGKPAHLDADGKPVFPPKADTYVFIGSMAPGFWIPAVESKTADAATPPRAPHTGNGAITPSATL
jgi:hypothetical protein